MLGVLVRRFPATLCRSWNEHEGELGNSSLAVKPTNILELFGWATRVLTRYLQSMSISGGQRMVFVFILLVVFRLS